MPTSSQTNEASIRNAVAQILQTSFGNKQIAIPGKDKRRHTDPFKPPFQIELFHETVPMGHHALIRLPALAGHELEQGSRFLLATEEEIEELIDERIVRGQGIPRQHLSSDL